MHGTRFFSMNLARAHSSPSVPGDEPVSPKQPESRSRELLWLAGLMLFVAVLAWPGLSSPRILDDLIQLDHVAKFEGVSQCFTQPDGFGLFRPLKNLFFYAIYHAGSDSLLLWHLIHLATHFAAVLASYFLLRRLMGAWRWALATVSLWALTPTLTVSAVWMSCANINLGLTFLAMFLLAHVRAQSPEASRGMSFLAGGLLFFSLFFYESLVVAVVLAFLCDRLILKQRITHAHLLNYAIYGALTLAYLVLRHLSSPAHSFAGSNPGFSPDMPAWQVFLSAPWFLMKHFLMWLFPIGRIEFVSSYIWGESAGTKELVISWILVLGAVAGAVALWKRSPLLAFGILWFGVTSFPSSNFVPVFAGPIADYYLIIPSIGLAIALGTFAKGIYSLRHHPELNRPELVAGVMLVALFGWRATYVPLAFQRADLWNDPAALYLTVAETRPHQYLAKSFAATELYNRGMVEEAITLSEEAISKAPWNSNAYLVAGLAHSRQGDRKLAAANLNQARRTAGLTALQDRAALRELARIHISEKKFEEARAALLPLLETEYDHEQRIPAILLMAQIYREQANHEKAVATLERGLGLYPGEPNLVAQLGALQKDGLTPVTKPGSSLDAEDGGEDPANSRRK